MIFTCIQTKFQLRVNKKQIVENALKSINEQKMVNFFRSLEKLRQQPTPTPLHRRYYNRIGLNL